ncbi:hypothetical protein ROLI_021820 [Roseobacter fucihabitans]|uniref:Uncharacterized protein n=1 Tax=Roseobacter fucihabitans TaxID=1537242 RepID=A0ABZ2BSU2_9RHOB|nr:hypothetical protein [Roseobacter litoralis]
MQWPFDRRCHRRCSWNGTLKVLSEKRGFSDIFSTVLYGSWSHGTAADQQFTFLEK